MGSFQNNENLAKIYVDKCSKNNLTSFCSYEWNVTLSYEHVIQDNQRVSSFRIENYRVLENKELVVIHNMPLS